MDGRVENHMGGGFLATAITMAITYVSGWMLDVSGRLGDAWAHITPGQAALVVGLLTYGTHNVPKIFRAAAGLYRRLPGKAESHK